VDESRILRFTAFYRNALQIAIKSRAQIVRSLNFLTARYLQKGMSTSCEATACQTQEMSKFADIHGSEGDALPQWQQARSRLGVYLRALNLAPPEQHDQIISAVLDHAVARQAELPEAEPLVLVMGGFQEFLEHWFQRSLPSGEPSATSSLVSFLAIDAGQKWPETFLTDEPPVEMRQALQTCIVRAAPDLQVSRMVPQPFENVLDDLNLPTALVQLTRDLPPSVVAKVTALVVSGLALLFGGNRLR
jgi:hypothetical protein